MKVKELIEKLKSCNPESLIVLAGDEEGNFFHGRVEVDDDAAWEPDKKEVKLASLTDEDRARGYTEDDLGSENSVPAVVLWPS